MVPSESVRIEQSGIEEMDHVHPNYQIDDAMAFDSVWLESGLLETRHKQTMTIHYWISQRTHLCLRRCVLNSFFSILSDIVKILPHWCSSYQ